MAPTTPVVTGLEVETVRYPPAVKPPGSTKTLFLAGAGFRGGMLNGTYVKATTTGLYFEDDAVPWLAAKWKGKTADELFESNEFFRDIVTGPFEKFFRLTHILPLVGKNFSAKVMGNCADIIKSAGAYGDAEAKAIDKFKEIYSDKELFVGFSNLYHQSPTGSLTITFTEDGSIIPEKPGETIDNKPVSEALLDSIIGSDGVSPATRRSLAERLSQIL